MIRGSASRLTVLTTVLLGMLVSGHASGMASDEVVIQASTASSRITISCQIQDYTGRYLVARTATGDQRFTAEEVVAVKIDELPAHARGTSLLAAGEFADAAISLEQALSAEPRLWVRREILALLVRCALRRSDFATAGMHFRALYASDPDTRHIQLIPLLWTSQTVGGLTLSTARAWLQEKDAITRLMGASLLLFDPDHRQHAEEILKELNRTPGERVRTLSLLQQRRQRIHARDISQFDVEKWEELADRTEPALKAPAWFMVGQALQVRQEFDLAAAAYLRLPLVYRTDHPMTVDSLYEASSALEHIGQRAESERLLDELLRDYPHSRMAERVRRSRASQTQPDAP